MQLVLSTFTGAGLLDIGFEAEGFCVVSAGDIQFGRDIRCFHPPPGRFEGVIGGPPCQQFSRISHMARHMGYDIKPNLIPEFERVVSEAKPQWFLMENVSEAPEPAVDGFHVHSFLLNNRWLGEEQNRLRRFSFGHIGRSVDLLKYIEQSPLYHPNFEPALLASGSRQLQIRFGAAGKPKSKIGKISMTARSIGRALELQGLPQDFFGESPLTIAGKCRLLGNGVPVPMARAVAKAIREAIA